jgi:hypothetical protein
LALIHQGQDLVFEKISNHADAPCVRVFFFWNRLVSGKRQLYVT